MPPNGMSDTSPRAEAGTESRIERLQPWIAALASALLHLLMLVVLLWSSQPVVTPPQGAASGSRMRVEFIDRTGDAAQAPPSPPPSRPPTPPSRTVTTSKIAIPNTRRPDAEPVQPPSVPEPTPPSPEDDAARKQAQAAAARAAPSPRRRTETWTGRPPGLIEEDLAPENAGLSSSRAIHNGDRQDLTAAEPNMEVGGYQVYYDLRSEAQVRAWKAQGMTELFLPLPGTQRYMICPLQTALDRGSGKCRLLDPGSPEMKGIGDARQVITVFDVYRRGEKVWSGPGAYR